MQSESFESPSAATSVCSSGPGHVVGASDTIHYPPLKIDTNSLRNLQGERETMRKAENLSSVPILTRFSWNLFLIERSFLMARLQINCSLFRIVLVPLFSNRPATNYPGETFPRKTLFSVLDLKADSQRHMGETQEHLTLYRTSVRFSKNRSRFEHRSFGI